MKKLAILFAVITLIVACNSGDKKADASGMTPEQKDKVLKDSSNYTNIQWLDSTYSDLGKVKEGQVVEVAFRFKNTGNKNLVIMDVTAGCGCTIQKNLMSLILPVRKGSLKQNSIVRTGKA